MKTTFLEFEQPIAELENRIEELRFVQDDSAVDISEEIQRLTKRSQTLTKDIYGKLPPGQRAEGGRPPAPASVHARLHPGPVHPVRGAARRPRLLRRHVDRRRAGALQRPCLHGARP